MPAYFPLTDAFWHLVASGLAIIAAAVALCTLAYLIVGKRAAIGFALTLLAIAVALAGYAVWVANTAVAG